jgi:predicted glycoside hydrolase/deacetylase ChbG (UPF0249 family)
MHYLIINADGYGFTAGVTRAIEECIAFGTVRSISANVNFEHANRLEALVRAHPGISVGCHLNPVVGKPVLSPGKVQTLLNERGEFYYDGFTRRFLSGQIKMSELRAEMIAQIEKTRDLAGKAFSHIDFHMGLHRLPGLYDLFLDVVEQSGVGRIRTHRYLVGMESRYPRMTHAMHLVKSPTRVAKFAWNLWLRRRALARRLAMPDRWVEITDMASHTEQLTVQNYLMMLKNLPAGINEFVAHPGYVDDELRQWSSYLEQRVTERRILMDPEFREALHTPHSRLITYHDIVTA